jgi:predicted DNA-binding ribbon-helix-helix protein
MAKEWRSLRVEFHTYELLRDVANARGMTYSALLDELLSAALVREWKRAELMQALREVQGGEHIYGQSHDPND